MSTTAPTEARRAHQLDAVAAFFDEFAQDEPRWRRRNRTYHHLIESVHRMLIPEASSILEIGCGSGDLLAALRPARGLGVDVSPRMVELARSRHPELEFEVAAAEMFEIGEQFDYIVLSDVVPYIHDLLATFKNLAAAAHPGTRLVVHSYSQLWRPVIRIAELLRLKSPKPLYNWVNADDVTNLLTLSGFEVVTRAQRILVPKKIPVVSTLLNGVVGSIWPFRWLSLTYWIVARPRPRARLETPSTSVIVPCRNEEGNIAEIVRRIPAVGSATEIVFVEGGSRDGTHAEIERQIAAHPERDMSLHVQNGSGKADAVRLGFAKAKHDIVMILDGDLSVPPEDLPSFYAALADGTADFVNGSRLVYGLEPGAMRFLNVLGNKLFSTVYSYLLGQPVKDTLCGTKALYRSDYEQFTRARGGFGHDPFGDFELLLTAAQFGRKIVDLPVHYHARTYGATNISRFRHGLLLLKMSFIAFYALKVRPMRA